MTDFAIGPGVEVTLHFSLKLQDGSVIDSNFDGEPASFVVGDGKLLSGFEKLLFGLREGAKASFLITPDQAFGQPNPDNIQQIQRDRFDNSMELTEGLVLSFEDASGGELPGVVTELDEEIVTVDFNHPLAGRDIIFDVEILDVKPATMH